MQGIGSQLDHLCLLCTGHVLPLSYQTGGSIGSECGTLISCIKYRKNVIDWFSFRKLSLSGFGILLYFLEINGERETQAIYSTNVNIFIGAGDVRYHGIPISDLILNFMISWIVYLEAAVGYSIPSCNPDVFFTEAY